MINLCLDWFNVLTLMENLNELNNQTKLKLNTNLKYNWDIK